MNDHRDKESRVEKAMMAVAEEEGYGWRDILSYAYPIARAAIVPFYSMSEAQKKVGASNLTNHDDFIAETTKILAYLSLGLIFYK